jgi:hypothetical protein
MGRQPPVRPGARDQAAVQARDTSRAGVVALGVRLTVPSWPPVLRHARLRDANSSCYVRAHGTGGHLAIGEQLEDPAPHRIAKHIERVHDAKLQSLHLYESPRSRRT